MVAAHFALSAGAMCFILFFKFLRQKLYQYHLTGKQTTVYGNGQFYIKCSKTLSGQFIWMG